jgi:cytochrome P450
MGFGWDATNVRQPEDGGKCLSSRDPFPSSGARCRKADVLRLIQGVLQREWAVRLLAPAIGKFNPFLGEFRADPYPFYASLRAHHPIYFSPSLRGWILTRHADIAAVFQDARFAADRTQSNLFRRLKPFRGIRPDFTAAITTSLLMIDPPRHTRLRRLVNKAFTPRVVENLRPRIQAIVDELLDRVAARGEMELMRDLAGPLPVRVIAEMLGIPPEDHEDFKRWSDALTVLVDPMQGEGGFAPAEQAFESLAAYLRRVFDERRRAPRGDLISALVGVEEQGDALTDAELLSLSGLILGAGHETTTNLLGNAVVALLRNPAERRRLQDDPSLIASAVEEILRYDSPVQLTDRVATEDCEVAGRPVRKGVLVALVLGAANRDPERFAEPDRLDVGRADNHHVAFGHGAHFCLGAALARAEAQIALSTLMARFPDLGGDGGRIEWKRSMVLRGPKSLPVRW